MLFWKIDFNFTDQRKNVIITFNQKFRSINLKFHRLIKICTNYGEIVSAT